MKTHKTIALCIIFCLIFVNTLATKKAIASWTFFLYMEATKDLQDMAIKTINDIASNCPDSQVNFYVLLHAYDDIGWLYKISKNTITLIREVPVSCQASQAIFSEIKTIFPINPAHHYGLILWNHGTGILIPKYNHLTDKWEIDADGQDDIYLSWCTDEQCTTNKKRFDINEHQYHRGMLKNNSTKTCMNNEEMVKLFNAISTQILDGKKLDICGLDMCLGAMVEHGYQLRNYVHYLVGSQDCELRDGWDFRSIMKTLTKNPNIDPKLLVQKIVTSYKTYYDIHAPIGRYTQSALDLNYMNALKENIDAIINDLKLCQKYETINFKKIIHHIRTQSTQFCLIPAYADLHNIYTGFLEQIDSINITKNESTISQLKNHLIEGCSIIEQIVVANITGSKVSNAQGLSIYFPLQKINTGYASTHFSKESYWLDFLQKITE